MSRISLVSFVVLTVVMAVVLSCGTLGLAVRQGIAPEILWHFPPRTPFQFIVRIGSDSYPWRTMPVKRTAINVWAHQQGTSWHVISIVHIPLGDSAAQKP